VNTRSVEAFTWPDRWQSEAAAALAPFVDTVSQVEVLVGPPEASLSGSLFGGYVHSAPDGSLWIIHDHSGRSDVYPWDLPSGPVLRLVVRTPGKRRRAVFEHPTWHPR
jgi:hypothetical protein